MSAGAGEARIERVLGRVGIERAPHHVLGVAVFCLALVARVGYWAISGTGVGAESENFVDFCTALASDPSSVPSAIEATTGVGTTAYWLLYSGYWGPMCGIYAPTGGSLDAVVLAQVLASSLTPVLLFYAAYRLVDLTAATVAGVAMALLMDTFAWSTRVLTDSPFVFVLALTVWQLARYRSDPTRRNRLLVWGCFVWLSVTRPNGIALVLGWLVYDLFPEEHGLRPNVFPYRSVAIGGAVLAIPVLIAVVVGALTFVADHWRAGYIIANDPVFTYEYTPRPSDSTIGFFFANLDHLLILAVLKVAVFFLPVVDRFALVHNVANVAVLLPVTLLSFVGAYWAVRRETLLARDWLTPYAVTVAIIAGTHVDYSWGYRAPATVLMVLLAGYAVSEARNKAA